MYLLIVFFISFYPIYIRKNKIADKFIIPIFIKSLN